MLLHVQPSRMARQAKLPELMQMHLQPMLWILQKCCIAQWTGRCS